MMASRPELLLVYEPEKACLERLIADGHASGPRRRNLFLPGAVDGSRARIRCTGGGLRRRGASPSRPCNWTMPQPPSPAEDAHENAGLDADRRHRLFSRRRGAGAGPAERPADRRRRRFAVRALPGQVPLRRGAWRARPAGAAGRPCPRRQVAGRAAALARPAGSSSRTGSAPRSASGRTRTAATSAMRWRSAAASSPAYRDDAVVQPYVAGRNVRASFLGLKPDAGVEALGIAFVDSGADFQTMEDSLALYGETGEAAKAEGQLCRAGTRAGRRQPAGRRCENSSNRRPADERARPARRVLHRSAASRPTTPSTSSNSRSAPACPASISAPIAGRNGA